MQSGMAGEIPLHHGVSLNDVADATRDAIVGFLELAPTKADLTQWLRGPYRRATSFVPHVMRSLATVEQPLAAHELADVIHHAQCAARQAIAATLSPSAEGLARTLPPVLKLAEIADHHGNAGFAAVDVPCCLADRVLALIVAEYLTRPEEFVEAAEVLYAPGAASSGVFARATPSVHALARERERNRNN